jgi:hypothetical protein
LRGQSEIDADPLKSLDLGWMLNVPGFSRPTGKKHFVLNIHVTCLHYRQEGCSNQIISVGMLKVYVRTFDDNRAYFSTFAVAAPKTTGPRELVGVPTCASTPS